MDWHATSNGTYEHAPTDVLVQCTGSIPGRREYRIDREAIGVAIAEELGSRALLRSVSTTHVELDDRFTGDGRLVLLTRSPYESQYEQGRS